MNLQITNKKWIFIENLNNDLIKVINEDTLEAIQIYKFDDQKIIDQNLMNIFMHFNRDQICENLAELKEIYVKDNNVIIKYEYQNVTLFDLIQNKVLELSQKNQILNCLINIFQFLENEKVIVKKIETSDFLVTDFCDLKLILRDNLQFQRFNYKNNIIKEEKFLSIDLENDYVFYQAPEILFQGKCHNNTNVWSFGIILIEIILDQQIFRSQSLIQLIQKIVAFTGKPSTELMNKLQINPKYQKIFQLIEPQQRLREMNYKQRLYQQIGNKNAKKLLEQIFQFDPEKRISFDQIIQSDYFKEQKIGHNIIKNKGKNLSKKIPEIISNKDLFISFGSVDIFNSFTETNSDNSQYFEILCSIKLQDFLQNLQDQELNLIRREGFLIELEKYLKKKAILKQFILDFLLNQLSIMSINNTEKNGKKLYYIDQKRDINKDFINSKIIYKQKQIIDITDKTIINNIKNFFDNSNKQLQHSNEFDDQLSCSSSEYINKKNNSIIRYYQEDIQNTQSYPYQQSFKYDFLKFNNDCHYCLSTKHLKHQCKKSLCFFCNGKHNKRTCSIKKYTYDDLDQDGLFLSYKYQKNKKQNIIKQNICQAVCLVCNKKGHFSCLFQQNKLNSNNNYQKAEYIYDIQLWRQPLHKYLTNNNLYNIIMYNRYYNINQNKIEQNFDYIKFIKAEMPYSVLNKIKSKKRIKEKYLEIKDNFLDKDLNLTKGQKKYKKKFQRKYLEDQIQQQNKNLQIMLLQDIDLSAEEEIYFKKLKQKKRNKKKQGLIDKKLEKILQSDKEDQLENYFGNLLLKSKNNKITRKNKKKQLKQNLQQIVKNNTYKSKKIDCKQDIKIIEKKMEILSRKKIKIQNKKNKKKSQRNFKQKQKALDEDYKYSLEEDQKICKEYYKDLQSISYKSLNLLLKKGWNKSSARYRFIQIHKDQNDLIFCVYSNTLLYKKGKEIQQITKEHVLPRFYLKKSNYQFENNIQNIVPISFHANNFRAHKSIYCPYYMKQGKCDCSNHKKVNNQEWEFFEDNVRWEYFPVFENYYQNLTESIIGEKVDNKEGCLYMQNEFGYFFYGNPGFFCPKNNIGALARIILYGLVKHKKIFDKTKKKYLDLNFLKKIASEEPVQEWEKQKNYKKSFH